MSVRKRAWSTNGVEKTGWQADYVDAAGKRRRKLFDRKKDADAFLVTAKGEVRDGIHVTDRETVTVKTAGDLWVKAGIAAGLEHSTVAQRKQHLNLHIAPFIGDVKLNKLTVPSVRDFQDRLREAGRSSDMIKRATVSLGGILSEAQSRGLTIRNPVREGKRSNPVSKRAKSKLQVGVDIPSPAEIKTFLASLSGKWRPLLMTAVFTGMRSSELRGLTWANIDLDAKVIHVRQRADDQNQIGMPKSASGNRSITIPPPLVAVLREWKLACPHREGRKIEYAFPTGAGNIETRTNILKRGLIPAMIAAGLTADTDELDEKGEPILKAKYSGLHSLRHFYASWCINPVSAGGLGLSPKAVQERIGHSTIAMTMDTYGHLFPAADEAELLESAAQDLIG